MSAVDVALDAVSQMLQMYVSMYSFVLWEIRLCLLLMLPQKVL